MLGRSADVRCLFKRPLKTLKSGPLADALPAAGTVVRSAAPASEPPLCDLPGSRLDDPLGGHWRTGYRCHASLLGHRPEPHHATDLLWDRWNLPSTSGYPCNRRPAPVLLGSLFSNPAATACPPWRSNCTILGGVAFEQRCTFGRVSSMSRGSRDHSGC